MYENKQDDNERVRRLPFGRGTDMPLTVPFSAGRSFFLGWAVSVSVRQPQRLLSFHRWKWLSSMHHYVQ